MIYIVLHKAFPKFNHPDLTLLFKQIIQLIYFKSIVHTPC